MKIIDNTQLRILDGTIIQPSSVNTHTILDSSSSIVLEQVGSIFQSYLIHYILTSTLLLIQQIYTTTFEVHGLLHVLAGSLLTYGTFIKYGGYLEVTPTSFFQAIEFVNVGEGIHNFNIT